MPTQPRILFVDDEPAMLESLRRSVWREFEADLAMDADHGLDYLRRSGPYCIVVSDMRMPGMNGAELAREIKTKNPHLPVILISGVNDIPPGASVADAFVSKVEGPDVLGKRIAAVLHRGKTQQDEPSAATC